MKIRLLPLISLAILAALPSCFSSHKPEASPETEVTGEEEVEYSEPVEYRDTVCQVGGKILHFRRAEDGHTSSLYLSDEQLSDDPTIYFHSVGKNRYRIDVVGRSLEFSPSDSDLVSRLRAFFAPLDGFERINETFRETYDNGAEAHFYLVLDRPTKPSPLTSYMISLAAKYSDSPLESYDEGYVSPLASASFSLPPSSPSAMAEKYFASMAPEPNEEAMPGASHLFLYVDIRPRIVTPRYVTCRVFTHDFGGGAHGLYEERLVTIDRRTTRALLNNDIFRAGTEQAVIRALLDTMASDPLFSSAREGRDFKTEVLEEITVTDPKTGRKAYNLPPAALTPEGVTFSFQPYSIGSFAEGAWHFTVPYSTLSASLTPEAKALVN